MSEVESLSMEGGVGDGSYTNNSSLQQKVISMTWPIAKEVITDLYCRTLPAVLTITDLGCSSGPNTFIVVSNLIKQVENIRQQLGKDPVEYQVFLNDLPANDFNTIFRALPSFLKEFNTQLSTDVGPCLFTGVPGSFYGRLFPSKSLHFIHSSNSLHWLSQVPEGIENKDNIFMSRTSPKSVLEAYYKQFQKDFSMFLKYRAQELMNGGCMILTIVGRTSEDRSSKECCSFWELLGLALYDMVKEGRVEKERADSFNIPNYIPSLSELQVEISNEGSFIVNRLEISRVNWSYFNAEFNPSTLPIDNARSMARAIRAVIGSLLAHHFGETFAIDELFRRYEQLVVDLMSKEIMEFIIFIVSLTKTK